jgi:predicted metal-dependent RNase
MPIDHSDNPCITISASGMAIGDRVVHLLANMHSKTKHTIFLAGYHALRKRGRRLDE